jgi:glucose/arabinose dehydrogenase
VSWPAGQLPTVPAGFDVSLFAENLDNPRTIYVLPNGDVLVMESLRRDGESRIILFRDVDKNGKPDRREVFLRRLNMAFGMVLVGARFYVGNTDAIVVFPYSAGETRIRRRAEKILDLPAGGHYTRNIVAGAQGISSSSRSVRRRTSTSSASTKKIRAVRPSCKSILTAAP